MNDRELYKKCVTYGRQVLKARRKFIGLLPEVFRRKLYLKKGYGSIHEFAAKLAGVSHDQVNRVLHLEKRFENRPVLRAALVEGKISVNKLLRIAPIVTSENEVEFAKKVEVLSNRALEVFVQDYKREKRGDFVNENGLFELQTKSESVHVHESNDEISNVHDRNLDILAQQSKLRLDEDVLRELLQLQDKGIDVNQLLRGFLQKRKAEIEREKEEVGEAQVRECEDRAVIGMPGKRYVPVVVRRVVGAEFGTKCAVEGCGREAENLHHVRGFAKWGSHDPRFLKPLCKAHHELAHVGDESVQRFRGARVA